LRHLVTLLDELQHLGVGLVSLREALDLTSPIGRAMFALVGVLAEVERAWIVERTHAAPTSAGAGQAARAPAGHHRSRVAPAVARGRNELPGGCSAARRV
jgi:DNA invertase Pin-like site-specific DNA recombinase